MNQNQKVYLSSLIRRLQEDSSPQTLSCPCYTSGIRYEKSHPVIYNEYQGLRSREWYFVFFPCPQISGSQVWLHIYLMSLTLSPRNSDWMVLRAARVLLCSPSCGQLRPLRVWDQLDVIYLFKRTDQINLVISALDSTFPNAMHSFLRALQGRQDRIFISILQVKTLKIQEKCQYSDTESEADRDSRQSL